MEVSLGGSPSIRQLSHNFAVNESFIEKLTFFVIFSLLTRGKIPIICALGFILTYSVPQNKCLKTQ